MLDIIRINFPGLSTLTEKFSKKGVGSYWGVLLLGIIFALAFCPYSGVLYFGMLIPLTISSSEGILLPLVFAIATGIPVIIFAWLIAYTLSGVGGVYKKIKTFEIWFRRVVAVLIHFSWVLLHLYHFSETAICMKTGSLNAKINPVILPLILLPVWFLLYHYLQPLADGLVVSVLGLTEGEHLTEAIRFFVFEFPKVMLLLTLIIFCVGIIRTYFTPERTRKALEG